LFKPLCSQKRQTPLKQGFLEKKMPSLIGSAWKRFFFVLYEDSLTYYLDEEQTQPAGNHHCCANPAECWNV